MMSFDDVDDYWSSDDGILLRLNMLGPTIMQGNYNRAVQVSASGFGVNHFKMVGPGSEDPRTCEWCGEHVDRVYRLGQFMPDLPKHPWCRHWWDLEISLSEKEREQGFESS